MPVRLLFFPDWEADPLWRIDGGAMVSLEQLPVPTSLRMAIRRWARQWEELARQQMDSEDVEAGMSAGPAPPVLASAEDEHWREGRQLWAQLQSEAGPDWQVGWASFPDGERHVQWTPGGNAEPCPPDRGS